eukprot:CAMPEP_0197619648 /NCGR_PEP_ID=MMETSP1338-20131121/641_1 /TAXON_ID=43686 ORGANISM="Pelagodinium beii, Strain RCC1491" /NCGR_SAMPLE_ID=MMETSP1338 /ASSEMBLY_ACC=CAM_ASM_000754 /LENGTH=233 /DNA_ID=CAMNT_0043188653 /DNA_START=67 /DNA_END=765 /DNA_ORIENTATION=+
MAQLKNLMVGAFAMLVVASACSISNSEVLQAFITALMAGVIVGILLSLINMIAASLPICCGVGKDKVRKNNVAVGAIVITLGILCIFIPLFASMGACASALDSVCNTCALAALLLSGRLQMHIATPWGSSWPTQLAMASLLSSLGLSALPWDAAFAAMRASSKQTRSQTLWSEKPLCLQVEAPLSQLAAVEAEVVAVEERASLGEAYCLKLSLIGFAMTGLRRLQSHMQRSGE